MAKSAASGDRRPVRLDPAMRLVGAFLLVETALAITARIRRTNDPSANLVGQLGADWWQNATAQYAGLNANNTAVGLNN